MAGCCSTIGADFDRRTPSLDQSGLAVERGAMSSRRAASLVSAAHAQR